MGEQHEFRVDARARHDQLTAAGASLLFASAIVFAFWSEAWLRTSLGYAAGATIVLFLLWVLVREAQMMIGRRSSPVVLDEQGVRYASPGQIAWTEIAGIEQVPAMQRVDLLDAGGRVRVSLRYDLEEAGALVQFVADMLTARWPHKPLPQEYSYSIPVALMATGGTVLAALGGMAGLAYWLGGQQMIEVVCLGALALVTLCYAGIWNSSIRRLTIGSDGIMVAKGIKSQGLYYSDIAAVAIVLAERGRSERYIDVRVALKGKIQVSVLPRGGDPFDVYATLKRAWEEGRAAAAATPSIPASAA